MEGNREEGREESRKERRKKNKLILWLWVLVDSAQGRTLGTLKGDFSGSLPRIRTLKKSKTNLVL